MTKPDTDIPDPLISVIMATNREDSPGFLTEAVESILHQSHRNLEFLIITDGELDFEKNEYLDGAKSKDKRIRILSSVSSIGPSGARNVGISQAKGDYIAVMDADDISVTDRLKKQLIYIQKSKADLIGSAYYEIDEKGAVVGEKNMTLRHADVKKTAPLFSPVNGPTIFARSEVLKNIHYDERFHFGEDYRLCITLLRQEYKIENMDEKLLFFRRGPDFYIRRRGVEKALSDILNKLYALKLVPVYRYPLLFPFSIISSLMRMLPKSFLPIAYKIKYRLYNSPKEGYHTAIATEQQDEAEKPL